MKKIKYMIILLGCTQLNYIHTKNITVEIPATNLHISDKTIQEYLSDTMEEKSERDIEYKKKKYIIFSSFSLFKRLRTLFLICKDYVDLQYTLLKEYVFHIFKNI